MVGCYQAVLEVKSVCELNGAAWRVIVQRQRLLNVSWPTVEALRFPNMVALIVKAAPVTSKR